MLFCIQRGECCLCMFRGSQKHTQYLHEFCSFLSSSLSHGTDNFGCNAVCELIFHGDVHQRPTDNHADCPPG